MLLTNPLSETFFFHKKYFNIKSKAIIQWHFSCLSDRSGADPLIRNKKNQTPADVLLEEKPQGWEETLHYYNTFKPGTRTNGRGVGCGEKGIIIVEFKGFFNPPPLPNPVF